MRMLTLDLQNNMMIRDLYFDDELNVPLNQSASSAEFATVKLSPPNPNTSLPINITGHDLIDIPKLKIVF